ncbi:type IV secretion system DNA-binding domain-containing protein [Novosphingobium sp. JCM 18896]|uniref:type IV secretion system DNA-binding domain-containing protein n=1 Tax=Novosphingobium sp. JCM 18896 TaxID=2989731 RepID=UPI0022236323|nr:type IV secretion system DNA-binding domain-containing protein [Novosphingobium sp. JCM 18896]MCW1432022.1 type IV secretion system DNA-binding domain-containing protein [Novosphingobium sp. JCM 18896]
MADQDIRFSKSAATIEHHSARGKVVRNAGNFTRGSQLFSHELMMTWAGIRVPILTWLGTSAVLLSIISAFYFEEHEIQLCLMKIYAELWNWVALNPHKPVNLTLPDGSVVVGQMSWVPHHSAVVVAWAKFMRLLLASGLGSVFICAPLTLWFIDYSRKRGTEILKERHERGALLIPKDQLVEEIRRHNRAEFDKECADRSPPASPPAVLDLPTAERVRSGFHVPYLLAGIPYPWRLEQSHAMFIGTTGAGKTTELKKLVTQARARGHRCVIFDLTGSFVESFFNPDTDTILNTMDRRCKPWTIFSDCDNYAEFLSAATALIPSGHNAEDDFWQKAARTLFVEMCMKLIQKGATSNGALAYHLMQADLKTISQELENTVAAPLVATQAAKMAESIRATFNTHANALRFLPDPRPGEEGFSINRWMADEGGEGAILFITSTHPDLVLNRPLLTLWMDLAVNALFRIGRTRNLRTWFLLDEVHALHRLPAIEHGLQTARAVGGAFVLGIHSFGKLAETYGENGAINLGSLARTKLILTTSDIETAKRCSDFIGSREVRQMDEAYSYGYNNSRDASTITPRKEVQHLVMPDDIKELPSLHGFVKFPDGFPAAKIQLKWLSYPHVAEGFERVTTMRASEYSPEEESDDEMGEEGREGDGPDGKPQEVLDRGERQPEKDPAAVDDRSEAELSAEALRSAFPMAPAKPTEEPGASSPTGQGEQAPKWLGGLKSPNTGSTDDRRESEREQQGSTDAQRLQTSDQRKEADRPNARKSEQESLIAKEERQGIGLEEEEHRRDHDAGDDFGMEM